MIMVLFSSLVSLGICLVHDMMPGPGKCSESGSITIAPGNGIGQGGTLSEVQRLPLTALLIFSWGLLECLQQWKSATERGQPCETTVSPSASMGRGSGPCQPQHGLQAAGALAIGCWPLQHWLALQRAWKGKANDWQRAA